MPSIGRAGRRTQLAARFLLESNPTNLENRDELASNVVPAALSPGFSGRVGLVLDRWRLR
jgi:hypothetical protein